MTFNQQNKVLIAGAGIAGLLLAQGLKSAGIPFEVFERDESSEARHQGYMLRLSQWGRQAVQSVLSPQHLAELEQNALAVEHASEAGAEEAHYRMLSPDGRREIVINLPPAPNAELQSIRDGWMWVWRGDLHTSLSRGIPISYGKTVVDYTSSESDVTLRFADGSTASGALLVGADGSHSRIASQLGLEPPYHSTSQLIVGVAKNSPELRAAVHPRQLDAFSSTSDFEEHSAGGGPKVGGKVLTITINANNPEVSWIAYLPGGYDVELRKLRGPQLLALVKKTFAEFDPRLRAVLDFAEPDSTIEWVPRISPALMRWTTNPRVTVAGDSAHAFPSTGGIGANAALQMVTKLLEALKSDPEPIGISPEMIAQYETQMRDKVNPLLAFAKAHGRNLFDMDMGPS